MNIVVSACLLGVNCKYCGTNSYNAEVYKLISKHNLLPICPEQLGGLSTPRKPVELLNGRAMDKEKNDYTEQFRKGSDEVLKIARLFDCTMAILKSNSPSCGFGKIYDGSFNRCIIDGTGITAAKLQENGIRIISENTLELVR